MNGWLENILLVIGFAVGPFIIGVLVLALIEWIESLGKRR